MIYQQEFKMLTIIVPVYNEKKFIRVLLKKLIKIIKIKKQIIIIDDGSSDGTTEILRKETIYQAFDFAKRKQN